MPNPAKLTPGETLFHWRIIEIDPVGRRATVQCRCGQVRIIAA